MQSDDGREVAVPLEGVTLIISGYTYSMKALHERRGIKARVGDPSPPWVALPQDEVRLITDPPETVRTVSHIQFTPLGQPFYYLTMTTEEAGEQNKSRRQAAKKDGRSFAMAFETTPKGAYLGHEIVLLRRS